MGRPRHTPARQPQALHSRRRHFTVRRPVLPAFSRRTHSGLEGLPTIDTRFASFRLRVAPSPIDRFGVYAAESIPRGRKVIEYTGKRVPRRRPNANPHPGPRRRAYRILVNNRWVLDGAAGGSGAELINHSCQPNLSPRVLRGHVLLYSRRRIARGEELSWDYQSSKGDRRTPCRCGSRRCRGTINKS